MIGTVTLSPASAIRGAPIAVAGSGFGKRLTVTIGLDGQVVATVRSNSQGKFSTSFVANVAEGTHTVTAYSKSPKLEHTGSAQLTITPVVDAPPVISAIVSSDITETSVRFSWHVSEKAQGWVEYGPTTAYGRETRHETSFTYADHSQVGSGLTAGSLNHFRVHAIDSAGQHTISDDQTVTTLAAAGPPPPGADYGIPFTDLPGWSLVFADDFKNDVPEGQFPALVASRWGAYPAGYKDTNKQHGWGDGGTYDPKIISIHDDPERSGQKVMDIACRTENGVHLVATPTPILAGGSVWGGQRYGRYAVRFKVVDRAAGYKTAWLLWPLSGVWPRDGEIDFPEGDLAGVIEAYMHRQGATAGDDQDGFRTSAKYDVWHTAVMEWTPTRLEFFLDATSIGKATSRIPNTPMNYRLQTETTIGGPNAAATARPHVLVDRITVHAYAP